MIADAGFGPAGEALLAAVDLVGRTGARDYECGYLLEGVPSPLAGWWAKATYRGGKIIEENHRGPVEASEALARRLLHGAKCACGKLVALDGVATFVTGDLVDGSTWTADEAAAAGECRWSREGPRWVSACGRRGAPVT